MDGGLPRALESGAVRGHLEGLADWGGLGSKFGAIRIVVARKANENL
jgi:hypothetical protein